MFKILDATNISENDAKLYISYLESLESIYDFDSHYCDEIIDSIDFVIDGNFFTRKRFRFDTLIIEYLLCNGYKLYKREYKR